MDQAASENGRSDKPVPCPRCQSLNTKFCYFNNYNVKQPRHFCRQCQRYWTAGGSLRNVPVGAGRRKHKISQSKPSDSSANGNSKAPSSSAVSGPSNGVLKQGLSAPSVDSSSFISFNHHHSFAPVRNHGFGEVKVSQEPRNHGVDELNVSKETRSHGFTDVQLSKEPERVIKASNESEMLGFTEMLRQTKPEKETEIGLELKLSKDSPTEVKPLRGPQLPSTEEEAMHTSVYSRENSSAEKRDVYSFQHISHKQDSTVSVHDGSKNHDAWTSAQYILRKEDMAKLGQDHEDSTCCSSVTANLPGTVSEAISPPNSTTNASSIPGFGNPAVPWGPLMWPWLWPLMFNTSNVMLTSGMPQIDPAQLASFRAAVGAIMPHLDPAQIPSVNGMAVPNMPPLDPAFAAALTASFLQWQQAWNPYTWGLPWNAPWNTTNMNVNVPNPCNKRDRSPTREQQESNGIAKYPRAECQSEPAHGSGCSSEAVDANQKLNAGFERKPMVPHYQTDQNLPQSPHKNPAAQARSLAFQEGN